jgi:hypothetical protein
MLSNISPRLTDVLIWLLVGLTLSGRCFADNKKERLSYNEITYLELDEHNVYRIPVSTTSVTTISFPSEIEGLEGRNISMRGEQAMFTLSYTPKSYYFSVAASQPKASTNLNVIWNNKTYVLELVDSPRPVYSVVFTIKTDGDRPLRVTPTHLLGLLDKAKAFPLLVANYPQNFKDVNVSAPKKIVDFGDFAASMDKIYRFDNDDTLVFELTLTNKTNHEVTYQPQGFAVRVGNNVYYQSISDASGKIPPSGSDTAYFAITGTPDGQRNDLSLRNDFTVIVNQSAPLESAPVRFRHGEQQGDGKQPVQ